MSTVDDLARWSDFLVLATASSAKQTVLLSQIATQTLVADFSFSAVASAGSGLQEFKDRLVTIDLSSYNASGSIATFSPVAAYSAGFGTPAWPANYAVGARQLRHPARFARHGADHPHALLMTSTSAQMATDSCCSPDPLATSNIVASYSSTGSLLPSSWGYRNDQCPKLPFAFFLGMDRSPSSVSRDGKIHASSSPPNAADAATFAELSQPSNGDTGVSGTMIASAGTKYVSLQGFATSNSRRRSIEGNPGARTNTQAITNAASPIYVTQNRGRRIWFFYNRRRFLASHPATFTGAAFVRRRADSHPDLLSVTPTFDIVQAAEPTGRPRLQG
jgi:hypothetical protein